MRPYGIKKDDPKVIQATATTLSGIQTSHLALLEATCSKIGDTFHESAHPIFTQKNLTNIQEKKSQDNTTAFRSCLLNSIPSTIFSQSTICANQRSAVVDLSTNHQSHFTSQQTTTNNPTKELSSCLKIKTEHNTHLDYNQNCTESMHICPNVINETRILESQARASFSRSCCHENQSPSCAHQTNTSEQSSLNVAAMNHHQQQPSACQHEQQQNTSSSSLSHIPSPSNSNTSSCLFQSTSPASGSSQSSSCGMTTLSHLPISASNNNNNNNNNSIYSCENSSFTRQKTTAPSINPWQNQSVHRAAQEASQPKSSCMLHDNFSAISSASSTHQSLSPSPQERAFRTYSPPEQQDRQFSTNFRSPEYGPPSVESQHTSPHYAPSIHSPHQQHTFDGYPTNTFENPMDVKPDPYTLHQQSLRSAHSTGMIPGSYDSHSHTMGNLQNTLEPMNGPPALQSAHYMGHNHPPAMSYGNPTGYPGNFSIHQNPDLVPGNPMAGPPDMVSPNFVDYQYQQQMFYSRENRRPRRIACTCPNCRDGENKTVTTKDGKQRKLHVCHILGCGKEYGKTSHLRAHLRWHAGERPFACNWLYCNKRFTRSDELQRHRRTHTGDKRFECSTCFKKFMRSDHLSKHMKTHQSQNKQGKDKSNENTTDKNKSPPKNTQQHKQTVIQSEKSRMTSLGLPESLNL